MRLSSSGKSPERQIVLSGPATSTGNAAAAARREVGVDGRMETKERYTLEVKKELMVQEDLCVLPREPGGQQSL